MALYWTRDVEKIMNDKLAALTELATKDENLSDELMVNAIHEIRIFRKFANMIITDMEEADRQEDEERIARELAKEAAKSDK